MRRSPQTAAAAFSCALIAAVMAAGAGSPIRAQALPEVPTLVPPAWHQNGTTPVSVREAEAALKTVASQIAVALTTYDEVEGPDAIAKRLPPSAAGFAGALHHPGAWSRGRIIYPQLGGLSAERASVMVVVEQMIGDAGGLRVEIRTLDVRLALVGHEWVFSGLASSGGEPVLPPAGLSAIALAVVNDPRIELPDSARWDIFEGRVSQRLLRLMAEMAEVTPYGVVTLLSGHPLSVFDTDRQSDHTRGLAVDIYRLSENLVVDQRSEESAAYDVLTWLYEHPDVRQIGSPWALDARGGKSFTDAVHNDHIHIAVYPD